MIKKFKCGLCKEHLRKSMTRKGLRLHIRKEHFITSELTNSGDGKLKERKKWWIDEEFK